MKLKWQFLRHLKLISLQWPFFLLDSLSSITSQFETKLWKSSVCAYSFFAHVLPYSQQISIVLGEYVTDISESAEDTGELKELVTTEDGKLVIP